MAIADRVRLCAKFFEFRARRRRIEQSSPAPPHVVRLKGIEHRAGRRLRQWAAVADPYRKAEELGRLDPGDHHDIAEAVHCQVAGLPDRFRQLTHYWQRELEQYARTRLLHSEREQTVSEPVSIAAGLLLDKAAMLQHLHHPEQLDLGAAELLYT